MGCAICVLALAEVRALRAWRLEHSAPTIRVTVWASILMGWHGPSCWLKRSKSARCSASVIMIMRAVEDGMERAGSLTGVYLIERRHRVKPMCNETNKARGGANWNSTERR